MKIITPQVIRVRDFRSFNDEQVVSLAQQPGLLGLITGVNQAEPDLGANGTGKSTIWDALCWCLFGKTIRGLRGPTLMPWGVDVATPRVQFTFEVDGHRHTISRTASPNGVRLFRDAKGPGADTRGIDGEDIDQRSIERMIGMDYDLFLSTVVRGQFADSFLELTPKKKMEFLSSALDLDCWDEAAKTSSELRKQVKASLADADKQLSAAWGRLSANKDAYGMAERATKVALDAAESRRQDLLDEQAVKKEELLGARKRAQGAAEELDQQRSKLELTKARLEERKLDTQDKADQLISLEHSLAKATAIQEIHEAALEAAESLGAVCGTCDSELSEGARQAAQGTARKELKASTDHVRDLWTKCQTQEAILADAKKLELALRSSVDQFSTAVSACEKDIVYWDGCVEKLELQVETLEYEESYSITAAKSHLSVMGKRLEASKDDHEKQSATVEDLQQKEKDLDFWVTGFQDIRLWRLRAALDELEALANSHTLSLGLRGWRILFEVERETKSGTIAKGFRCFIQSPTNTEPVPLETWSGGELQRLKLATQAAMCDLIRSRFGGAMALEVWDEPGQHLSQRGCADMMAFFRERAATLGIEIWIVDHRSTASGEFDQQLVVTRTKQGTVVKRGLR